MTAPQPELLKFAVVDVETTGGAGDANRITEIGIALLDGDEQVAAFFACSPGRIKKENIATSSVAFVTP